ncbi:MAG: TIGR01620 family protein [Pseudomonadota bacterium]
MAKGPVLIDLEDAPQAPSVTEAPPIADPDPIDLPDGRAMQMAARVVTRQPSWLARVFWTTAVAFVTAILSAAAWEMVTGWIERAPLFGWFLTVLVAVLLLTLLMIAMRELGALARLKRIDTLRHKATTALDQNDLAAARDVTDRLVELYETREETRWGRERLDALENDQMDAESLLLLVEAELLAPLDRAAQREVEAAARQVATVTALVPLALADVFAALTANLRMIRRIAEVYGGRTGRLGSWRLTRAVLAHLVATGAVAVGDDMLEPILGGSLLGKLSRRFGEGLVNGALTARVGVAAIEVCRPMAFSAGKRPKARHLVKQALSGLMSRSDT